LESAIKFLVFLNPILKFQFFKCSVILLLSANCECICSKMHIYINLSLKIACSNVQSVIFRGTIAQLAVHRLAVRQARVWFSAGYGPRKVFPTKLTSDEEIEKNLGEWLRRNVLYECDGMNVVYVIYNIKINKKSGIMPPSLSMYFLE
jgi:hypothetical protein